MTAGTCMQAQLSRAPRFSWGGGIVCCAGGAKGRPCPIEQDETMMGSPFVALTRASPGGRRASFLPRGPRARGERLGRGARHVGPALRTRDRVLGQLLPRHGQPAAANHRQPLSMAAGATGRKQAEGRRGGGAGGRGAGQVPGRRERASRRASPSVTLQSWARSATPPCPGAWRRIAERGGLGKAGHGAQHPSTSARKREAGRPVYLLPYGHAVMAPEPVDGAPRPLLTWQAARHTGGGAAGA